MASRGRPPVGDDRTISRIRLGDQRAELQAWATANGTTLNAAVREAVARFLAAERGE